MWESPLSISGEDLVLVLAETKAEVSFVWAFW